jgi:hypothetical protein
MFLLRLLLFPKDGGDIFIRKRRAISEIHGFETQRTIIHSLSYENPKSITGSFYVQMKNNLLHSNKHTDKMAVESGIFFVHCLSEIRMSVLYIYLSIYRFFSMF